MKNLVARLAVTAAVASAVLTAGGISTAADGIGWPKAASTTTTASSIGWPRTAGTVSAASAQGDIGWPKTAATTAAATDDIDRKSTRLNSSHSS